MRLVPRVTVCVLSHVELRDVPESGIPEAQVAPQLHPIAIARYRRSRAMWCAWSVIVRTPFSRSTVLR